MESLTIAKTFRLYKQMIKKMLKTCMLRVFDPQRICALRVYRNGFRE